LGLFAAVITGAFQNTKVVNVPLVILPNRRATSIFFRSCVTFEDKRRAVRYPVQYDDVAGAKAVIVSKDYFSLFSWHCFKNEVRPVPTRCRT